MKDRTIRRTLVMLGLIIIAVLFLPEVIPGDPTEIALKQGNLKPGLPHIFGTDLKGRDSFLRVLYGARLSLLIGLSATFVSLFIGVIYGAVSGMAGRRIDNLMMRLVDVLYGLPFMFVVIILMTIVGGRSVLLLFMALGMVQWLTMARVVRAEVLSVREKEFVTAARSLGAGNARILFRHILPNIADTVLVYATFTVPMVIIEEAFLSFLGLGVPAPMASLGTLIRAGIPTISVYPWQILFPAAVLLILVFLVNRIGWVLKRRMGV